MTWQLDKTLLGYLTFEIYTLLFQRNDGVCVCSSSSCTSQQHGLWLIYTHAFCDGRTGSSSSHRWMDREMWGPSAFYFSIFLFLFGLRPLLLPTLSAPNHYHYHIRPLLRHLSPILRQKKSTHAQTQQLLARLARSSSHTKWSVMMMTAGWLCKRRRRRKSTGWHCNTESKRE